MEGSCNVAMRHSAAIIPIVLQLSPLGGRESFMPASVSIIDCGRGDLSEV